MKTELILVSPVMARMWLKQNTENRPLRAGVVENFRIAYERGEWKTTHQGIAFSRTGRLLDGQHRLTFINQLEEDARVAVNVTFDLDDDLFGAIDQGLKRSISDVIGASSSLVAVGRIFARIENSNQSAGLSVKFITPYVEWVTPEYEELVSFSPASCLIWSSAPVRAAAVYQMKRCGDADFVKLAYHSLVSADIDSMPYAARILMQQRMSGKIVSARSQDLFCRALRAFDATRQAKIKSILITDLAGTLEDVRKFSVESMKKVVPVSEKKSAKPDFRFFENRMAS